MPEWLHSVSIFTYNTTGDYYYNVIGGYGSVGSIEDNKRQYVRQTYTWKLFHANIIANSHTGSTVFKSRVNSADGNQTFTVPTSTTGEYTDTSNTDSLSSGDYITGELNCANAGSMEVHPASVLYHSSSEYATLASNQYSSMTGTDTYLPVGGQFEDGAPSTEAHAQRTFRASSTLSKFRAYVYSNSETGKTSSILTRVNGGDGNQSFTISAGSTGLFEDTSNTDSISAGDEVNYLWDFGGGFNDPIYVSGVLCDSSSDNRQVVCASPDGTLPASSVRYCVIEGWIALNTLESEVQLDALTQFIAKNLFVYVATNNATSGYSYVAMRINGATSDLIVNPINYGVTGVFEDTSNTEQLAVADEINYVVAGNQNGTVIFTIISIEADYNVAGQDYPINTSCALSLSPSIDRDFDSDRSVATALALAVNIDRDFDCDRAVDLALTMATTIVRAWGRSISTSLGLLVSPSVDREVAYHRDTSSGLSMLASVVRSWAQTVATSVSLSLAPAVSIARGIKRSLSCALVVAPNIDRDIDVTRDTSSGLSLATSTSRKFDSTRSTSSALSMLASVLKSFGKKIYTSTALSMDVNVAYSRGWTVATNLALSLATSINRALAVTRDISVGLNFDVNLVPTYEGGTQDYPINISVNLSMSASITRNLTYTRATSTNLSLSPAVSRTIAVTRALTTNLDLSTAVSIALAWVRSTSSSLSLLPSVSRKFDSTRDTSSNLSLAVNISRAIAVTRSLSTGLSMAVNVIKSWGKTIATSTSLALSTAVSRTIAIGRDISVGLDFSVNIVPTYSGVTDYPISISVNLSMSASVTRSLAMARATSMNISLSPTIARVYGRVRSTTSNLSLSTTLAHSHTFVRALTANLSMATTTVRNIAVTRATSTLLELLSLTVKHYGKTITTSTGLTMRPIIHVATGVLITISTGLTMTANVVRTFDTNRAMSVALSMAVSVYSRVSALLNLKVVTTQYHNMKAMTTQYMKLDTFTTMLRKIKGRLQ